MYAQANKGKGEEGSGKSGGEIYLGTPVKPMLARQCNSVDEIFKRCPNGACVEIKYDGERLQV